MHGGSKYLDNNKFDSENPMTWILGKESIEHSASLGGYVEKHLDKCPPPGALGASCSDPPGIYRRKTILTF